MIFFVLGRQPKISLAELQALFPEAKLIFKKSNFAIFDNLELSQVDLNKIGGVVKFGRVVNSLRWSEDLRELENLLAEILAERFGEQSGKKNFGISLYGEPTQQLKTLLIGTKKNLRREKFSVRFVNKNFTNLSSPQSQFEILDRSGVELLLGASRESWFLAELIATQPFRDFAKRDYEKAARDARVGMLPPKLAQTMLNLAVGDKKNLLVYDPFCGTGTILVEALLSGHQAMGSDLDPRMVEYSEKNLAALGLTARVFVHDANRPNPLAQVDVVVTEGYLGPPRKTIPDPRQRNEIFEGLAQLYENFFRWIRVKRVVITWPFYVEGGRPKYFSSKWIVPKLERLGWEEKTIPGELLYYRDDQTVGREIVVLEKHVVR